MRIPGKPTTDVECCPGGLPGNTPDQVAWQEKHTAIGLRRLEWDHKYLVRRLASTSC